MADKGTETDIKRVKAGGLEVEVDLAFMRSWKGIRLAARMQSTERSDSERFMDVIDYYESAIPNLADVDEAMPDAEASEVFELLAEAVKKATPKN